MTQGKRRLDKIQVSLTPKQAVLLWMEEAHQHDTIEQYCQALKPFPEANLPLARLPDQVTKAVEQAMKGRPKEAVALMVRQAVRDVVFLFHLHQQVNRKFLEEDRHFWTRAMLLATELDALRRERFLRDQMAWSWFRVGAVLPYPLDPETAAAVDAAREHHVLTWEVLEQGDDITGWVQQYFKAQGKPELPYQSYSLRAGSRSSSSSGPWEVEVRGLFAEEAEFQRFLAGEDYEYGVAGVTDREFEDKWDAVFQGIKAMVASGEVQHGVVVELPTVPHVLLRDAPLVEGEWLDRYVVALAEWGALLRAKGYQLQEPEDSHPMACYRVVDPESDVEVEALVLKQVWAQTQKHLASFPGHTRDIQGRPYLHFQDYLRWRGRRAKGDFQSGLRRGLVLKSWNQWETAHDGDGAVSLDGVKVSPISSYLEGCRYHLCRDENEELEERRRRESLLRDLRGWQPGSLRDERYRRRVGDWREMASDFLCNLYSLCQAADAISQRFFDGRPLLFPAHMRGLARLVEVVEELVEGVNDRFANESVQESGAGPDGQEATESPNVIDITALKEAVAPAARQHAAFQVDMARAEALDAMGENRAAVSIVERHV
jgi:hypothetical protein